MGETLQPAVKRIDRKDDRNVYQPKIHADKIHQLYELGQQYNLPMTVILDRAIALFINQLDQQDHERDFNHQRQ